MEKDKMSEEEKKELQELINLLYNNHLSQYGKRKLEAYIKKQQKEIEELYKVNKMIELYKSEGMPEDTEMVLMHKKDFLRNFEVISKDTIKAKIKELKKMKLTKGDIFFKMRNYAILILRELLEE